MDKVEDETNTLDLLWVQDVCVFSEVVFVKKTMFQGLTHVILEDDL